MFDIHCIRAAAYRVAFDGAAFRFVDSNAACLALTGFTTMTHAGLTPEDIFAPTIADDLVRRYRACLAGETVSYESSTVVGGRARSWRTTLFAATTGDGEATIYGICGDADGLAHDRDLPRLALETLDGGFWTLDLATREFRTSRRLAEKLAGPGHESLNLAEYVSHIHAEDLSLDLPEGDNETIVEFRVFTHDRRMRWLRTRRRPIQNETGRTIQVVGVVLDITDEKTALMRLQAEVVTDKLTAIGNRRAFDRAATRRFGDESVGGIGLVLIDLDGFKPINDRHGHSVGDALLRDVAERLRRITSAGDLLSRIGGDEFAIIVAEATADGMGRLVEQIEAVFAEPFAAAGHAIAVAASCGSAVRVPSDRSVGDILARADRALYAAKSLREEVRARRLTA